MYTIKHQPKGLSDFFGNKNIVDAIKKYQKLKLFPQVMLFHGFFGMGKTVMAKYVAKVLSCLNSNIEPCNECESCLDITNEEFNRSVIYQKANSAGGKDDIKELEKQVYSGSIFHKNKVFIIEEFHNLSSKAVEVLLTILQKPPKNTYFIFITTEYEKIKPTIKSRCMAGLFEFKKANHSDLLSVANHILTKENVQSLSGEAIEAIVDNSEGSIRNFVSLLERCIMCEYWTKIDIIDNLGLLSQNDEEGLLLRVLKGDQSVIYAIRKLDMHKFYTNIRRYMIYTTKFKKYDYMRLMERLENVKIYPYFDVTSFLYQIMVYFKDKN